LKKKSRTKVRDPIHVFIELDDEERGRLDSPAFQRLRHIHQLAMTYLVYPGATHKRFEHSLGVMELAGRAFDVITNPENVLDCLIQWLPEVRDSESRSYWRRVLRAAALCHDMGHLPFSHAAEKELLPEGWSHERLSRALIQSEPMETIWARMNPPLRSEDIVRLALGPAEAPDLEFTHWQALLSEIIVGPAFGVDRMDYLLRDSYHTGVAYGKFDHYRLIDSLRILPPGQDGNDEAFDCRLPVLGISEGGLQAAESLQLARYFMYTQVYLHPVRRIYDIHLKDFLCCWLADKTYPIDPAGHLQYSDNEVLSAMAGVARNNGAPGCEEARRIVERNHYRRFYTASPEEIAGNPRAVESVFWAAADHLGTQNLRLDMYNESRNTPDFPVMLPDGQVSSALSLSTPLNHIPPAGNDILFVHPDRRKEALLWLNTNRKIIVEKSPTSMLK